MQPAPSLPISVGGRAGPRGVPSSPGGGGSAPVSASRLSPPRWRMLSAAARPRARGERRELGRRDGVAIEGAEGAVVQGDPHRERRRGAMDGSGPPPIGGWVCGDEGCDSGSTAMATNRTSATAIRAHAATTPNAAMIRIVRRMRSAPRRPSARSCSPSCFQYLSRREQPCPRSAQRWPREGWLRHHLRSASPQQTRQRHPRYRMADRTDQSSAPADGRWQPRWRFRPASVFRGCQRAQESRHRNGGGTLRWRLSPW